MTFLPGRQAQEFSRLNNVRNHRLAMLREAIRRATERQAMLDEDMRMQEIRQHAMGKTTMASRFSTSFLSGNTCGWPFKLYLEFISWTFFFHFPTHCNYRSDYLVNAIGPRNGSRETKVKPGLERKSVFVFPLLWRSAFFHTHL